jgi:malate dehydrogenase (oxaloacetate-decarboxylating)(NADP+)
MYMMSTKKGTYFFADTTVNQNPDTNTLVNTTLLAAKNVKFLGVDPKIALVSYSNFGTIKEGRARAVHEAVKILHEKHPELIVDGEMQANFALNTTIRDKKFPFSKLKGQKVNTLIFPNLHSGNIAYKMLQEIGSVDTLGPILCGVQRPIHIVQLESSVSEITNMTAIAVVDAQKMNG